MLPPKQGKKVQKVIGTFMFYARAVNSTMLVALNTLIAEQTHATQQMCNDMHHSLNYCITNPTNAVLQYCTPVTCGLVYSQQRVTPSQRSQQGPQQPAAVPAITFSVKRQPHT
jgi:uncharacterized protein YfaQ (DUF2300 family)